MDNCSANLWRHWLMLRRVESGLQTLAIAVSILLNSSDMSVDQRDTLSCNISMERTVHSTSRFFNFRIEGYLVIL